MANRDILIVEDEAVLGRVLSDALRDAGYNVTLAVDGVAGIEAFKAEHPDLVIADIMMPRMDGMTMVEEIRRLDSGVEVLFLSARSGAEDVVEGFRRGGNDYLRKPFSLEELMARIEALLARHADSVEGDTISIGNYRFDANRWTLTLDGTTRRLTARESAVLAVLARKVGDVVDSSTLLRDIWGDDSYYNLRSLNVFVSRLRGYLSGDKRIEIQSVRGEGYRLVVN
ncbi:MAG: response regulator transcription factor [Alistipes sp.]|nr:response regulator transcription factor [Alistipes sp.]